MKLIEFIGPTSSGKSTTLDQLKSISQKNTYGHFEYILKFLKVPYNRFTYLFILHPFLYVSFALGGVRFHYSSFFFKAFIYIINKKRPYPFIIKLKLVNNLIRTLGAYCFLLFCEVKHKNDDVVIIDEGIIQLINNIIINFEKKIKIEIWDKLLAVIPASFLTKVCLFQVSPNIAVERCLKRKDPAFGKNKLTKTQWLKFITNAEKSFAYLQSLNLVDLLIIVTNGVINIKQILAFIKYGNK